MSPGYGKILDIDLASRKIIKKEIDPEFARKYIGGVGFGCRILYDEVGHDVDPLGPENIIIFAIGALTGSGVPGGTRTEITTKHPLTRHIGTGNTGGSWGATLKHAGYDTVIVRNRADKPVYIYIDDDNVEIRDASNLWGKDAIVTTDMLSGELPPRIAVIAIGPGGENLVLYACPLNDKYHAAGRTGAGAVMGSKKLKAIAVRSSRGAPEPARPDEFREVVKEARARLIAADKAFWATGPHDILKGLLIGGKTSVTQELVKQYVTGRVPPCHGCPVTCYNGTAEIKEGKYIGTLAPNVQRSAQYGQFGAQLGIDNLFGVWKCKDTVNRLGLDQYTTSSVLAYAMELYKRGIVTKSDTDGLELNYGNEDAFIEMLGKIAKREGFGNILADGCARASQIIGRGAEKYCITIKGMDTSGDPRGRGMEGNWGTEWGALGMLTNPRGSDVIKTVHHHGFQYNPGWWADKYDMFDEVRDKIYGNPPQETVTSWEGQATGYKWFEDLHSLADSAGLCFVSTHMRLAFGPTWVSRMYSAYTGIDISPRDFMKTCERLFTLFKAYPIREGMTRKDDDWPERFYKEPGEEGRAKGRVLDRAAMDKMLDSYYEVRGWDKQTGLPPKSKWLELGLDDIARELEKMGILPT